jgi:hypothetical protein
VTAPAGAPEAARLDEVAAVTKEYATWSRTAYGFAAIGTGAVVLAFVALDVFGGAEWTRALHLLDAPVWLLLLGGARRYYQRHGVVMEPEAGNRSRRVPVALVGLMAALPVLQRFGGVDRLAGMDGPIATVALVLGAVGVPLLAAEVGRSRSDFATTYAFLMFGGVVARIPGGPAGRRVVEQILRSYLLAFLALWGAGLVVQGIREHLRYRRLERRLAALKAAAA